MKHTITEEGNFEITDRGQEVLHLDGEDLDMFLGKRDYEEVYLTGNMVEALYQFIKEGKGE